MTFIPNKDKKYNKGDEVVLNRDVVIHNGVFTEGHVFEIRSISIDGTFILVDEQLKIIIYNIKKDWFVQKKYILTEGTVLHESKVNNNTRPIKPPPSPKSHSKLYTDIEEIFGRMERRINER